MSSIEFPLLQKQTPLGVITDPWIPVAVRTSLGEESKDFLLDTGADFSTAPRRLAEQIGLQWESLPSARVTGVGGEALAVRIGELPIRLGDVELNVRCFFVDNPSAPLILGRADVLERLAITFDAGDQRITLTEIA